MCPPGHPLRFVTGVDQIFLYKGLDSAGSLKAAIDATQPDLIVPCDDGVVWQLHELHSKYAGLNNLIQRSLGSENSYKEIQSRGTFLELAAKLGIRVPRTVTVISDLELSGWCVKDPAVLKLDGTWGGSGVSIVHSPEEAVAAFRRMSTPMGAGFAWKRWLVNHDPLAIWSWRRHEKPSVTIQSFVPGRPANTMFACWEGKVLAIVTVEVLTSQGATGAATVVRLVKNQEIDTAARLLARRLRLSGFHGLDFMIEEKTGAAYLIELNPRSTQLGHLRLPGQGDLAGVLARQLSGEPEMIPPPEDCIAGDTVAFFPQTINWNPKSKYLWSGYHDVPWEEPALFRDLLLDWWPDRQWISRIYHYFRAPRKQEEAKF